MNDCYSPHTFEHIATDNPAPWMGRAGVEPPEFDAATAGAFWRDDAWEIVVAEPDQSAIIAQYEAALDTHLDNVAKQYRYQDRFSFALRAGFSGPYQAEGTAFAQWMDGCNLQAFDLLESVVTGEAPLPTISDFIGALPAFVIPS